MKSVAVALFFFVLLSIGPKNNSLNEQVAELVAEQAIEQTEFNPESILEALLKLDGERIAKEAATFFVQNNAANSKPLEIPNLYSKVVVFACEEEHSPDRTYQGWTCLFEATENPQWFAPLRVKGHATFSKIENGKYQLDLVAKDEVQSL